MTTLEQLWPRLEGASTVREIGRRMLGLGFSAKREHVAVARQACDRLGLSPTDGTLRDMLCPSAHTMARAEARNRASLRTNKKRYGKNRERVLEAKKERYEQAGGREWHRVYMRRRRAEDPIFRLLHCLRSRVHAAVRGTRRSAATVELLGCSIEELRAHLEARFEPGMCWDNYGSGWHLDHVRPCASFDLSDPAHQRACFHWSNLQPLWGPENLSKGSLHGGVRHRRRG